MNANQKTGENEKKKDNENALKIGKKTFLTAVAILGILMLVAGILTRVIPAGSYDRVMVDGREVVQQGTFHYTSGNGYPVWRWFTAPVEVLWGPDGAMVIVIIAFIMFIAGSFSLLEKSNVLSAVLSKIVNRFEKRKYVLLSVIIFFFMTLGAILGTFEECVALVPIAVALAYFLGWDSMVGLGMSILAACFGFSAAITNPFSVAIAQKISDLPLYSAMGYRIVIFLVFFLLLDIFLIRYAKKIERKPELSYIYNEDAALRAKYASGRGFLIGNNGEIGGHRLEKAILCFCVSMLLILVSIIAASMVPGLSDLIMPLIGVLFLAGSILSAAISGLDLKTGLKTLGNGVASMAPGIILILMAMSVKYIISNGGIMDTILNAAAAVISGSSPFAAIFVLYLLILTLELFIGSSSAKAFLVMPIIAPLADLVGLTRQSTVLAFCFGDGFSNVLYPTNPVLLICLGLTVVSYNKWFKWTIKLQLAAFVLSCIFMGVAVAIRLGPF